MAEINDTNDTQVEPPVTGNCLDSDSGRNYNMTGTTIASNGNQTDYCDATYPTWNLVEFFCNENDLLQSEWYLCSNGCDNGACI